MRPGRRDDALAFTGEARKTFERLGAETRTTIGGPGTHAGAIFLNIEAASATELGRFLDATLRDSDALSLQGRVMAADEMSLSAGLEYERRLFELANATEDRVEGMNAFIEKRKPEFKGR